jgi:hypothetical protein
MWGPDVVNVQKRLKVKGYDPGIIDGKYGPTTAHAVRLFQKANRLGVDGIYGPRTAKLLTATGTTTKPPPRPSPTSKGVLALREAVKHLGVKEAPASSNRTKFGVWFGVDGVSWCAIFTSYCFSIGAGVTICKGLKGAGCFAKGCAYVPTVEAWLRATGQWLGRVEPHPGDVAIYDWDGGVADHIGIVETYLGGGKFTAIEGNTSVGNDSDGGEVMRRTRYLSQVHGFGRLR